MNIVHTIKNETIGYQEKTAVIDGNQQITYGKLCAVVEKAAVELQKYGIRPFQRVALLCDDSIDYIVVSLAVLSLQAVIVPMSSSLSRIEVAAVLEQMDVNFFVFDRATYFQGSTRQIFESGIFDKAFFLFHRTTRTQIAEEYYAMNPAFIRFSSGTTGASKGVVLSHESIIQRTDAADKGLNITANDVVIWVLSMSFHFVVTILLFLRRAATIVLCSRVFPDSLLEGLGRHKGTFIYASPFHYHVLVDSDLFSPDLLSDVRLAVSTAMKLPVDKAVDFFDKFGIELSEAYGIIEVGLPFVNCSGDAKKRGSVGRILPGYEVKIVNVDAEGVGEVYLKGAGMCDAYFSPWKSKRQLLQDGWFNTSDLGRLDKDGFLYLVGRGTHVINFTGMKIFPYEVELVLNQHPAVEESLVYGVPHPQYGQLPSAKVVLREGEGIDFDSNELRKFCYQYLTSYKVPKEFECVNRLERTASGKLRR